MIHLKPLSSRTSGAHCAQGTVEFWVLHAGVSGASQTSLWSVKAASEFLKALLKILIHLEIYPKS